MVVLYRVGLLDHYGLNRRKYLPKEFQGRCDIAVGVDTWRQGSMDTIFFSWLASQPYSIEVAVGATFVVLIAPVVLAGIAALATWAEGPLAELLRMTGLLDPLEREKKTLWRLLPRPQLRRRDAADEPSAQPGERGTRAAS